MDEELIQEKEKVTLLGEKFKLQRDRHCMWIDELKPSQKRDGTPTLAWCRVTGYFRNYEDLFEDFAEKRFKTAEASTAKKLLSEMAKIEKETKALVKEFLKGK